MAKNQPEDIMSVLQETIEEPRSGNWLSKNATAVVGVESLVAAGLVVWALQERSGKKKALREVTDLTAQAKYLSELSQTMRQDAVRLAEMNARTSQITAAISEVNAATTELRNASENIIEDRPVSKIHALEFVMLARYILTLWAQNPANQFLSAAHTALYATLTRTTPGVPEAQGSTSAMLALDFLEAVNDYLDMGDGVFPGMGAQVEDLAEWLSSDMPEEEFADALNNILYMGRQIQLSYVGRDLFQLGNYLGLQPD